MNGALQPQPEGFLYSHKQLKFLGITILFAVRFYFLGAFLESVGEVE
jgi:hypothetical protein